MGALPKIWFLSTILCLCCAQAKNLADTLGFVPKAGVEPRFYHNLIIRTGTIGKEQLTHIESPKGDDILIANAGYALAWNDAFQKCHAFRPNKEIEDKWRLPNEIEHFMLLLTEVVDSAIEVGTAEEAKKLYLAWGQYEQEEKSQKFLGGTHLVFVLTPSPPYPLWDIKTAVLDLKSEMSRVKKAIEEGAPDLDGLKASLKRYERLSKTLEKGLPAYCLLGNFAK